MTTTIEVDEETLEYIKEARDILQKKFRIKMRMPEIMMHLVKNPEDVVERVSQSIKGQ